MFSSTEVKGKHPDAGNFFPQYMRLLSVAGNKSLQLSKQHLLFLAQPSWSHALRSCGQGSAVQLLLT